MLNFLCWPFHAHLSSRVSLEQEQHTLEEVKQATQKLAQAQGAAA
jgi:hypothetical protein